MGRIKMEPVLYFGLYLLNLSAVCIFIKLGIYFLKTVKCPWLETFGLIRRPGIFPCVLAVSVARCLGLGLWRQTLESNPDPAAYSSMTWATSIFPAFVFLFVK